MTPLETAALVAQVLAAGSAIMLAQRRAEHRPAAVALAALAAANLLETPILAALDPLLLPIEGPARVLVYLDGAFSLSYYAIVAGLAVFVAVSPERRRFAVGIVGAAWLLASIVLAALYPSPLVRGAGLQRIYFDADLIGLFVSTVALISWARAGIAARRSPDGVHAVALGLVTFDALILLAPFSPWRADLFTASYLGPQLVILVFFAVVTTAQVIAWKFSSRGSI